jgi:hypothetical protein
MLIFTILSAPIVIGVIVTLGVGKAHAQRMTSYQTRWARVMQTNADPANPQSL